MKGSFFSAGGAARAVAACAALVVAAGAFASCAGSQNGMSRSERRDAERIFMAYRPFGLVHDSRSNRLYFHGEPVRFFEDIVSENHRMRWPFRDGSVDVRAVRDAGGELVGVEAFSRQEFDDRTPALAGAIFELQISRSIRPAATRRTDTLRTGTRREDNPALDRRITRALARTYAVYRPFGLAFDSDSGWFYFHGESIDFFEDPAQGRRSGTYRAGGLNVAAVRDGRGRLVGVEAFSR